MTQVNWPIESPTGRCAATGRAFQEGEEYFSVLFEEGESFRRADYSLEAWHGPPDAAYCHFKSRVPIRKKQKRWLADDEVLESFFLRLEGEQEPVRIQFRFVLALILMRKRRVRYEGSAVDNGTEWWTVTLMRDRSTHRVANPRLAADQLEEVSRQLSGILHSDVASAVAFSDSAGGESCKAGSDE